MTYPASQPDPIRVIFFALLLASNVASAELYRCAKGSQVSYQDSPCAGSSNSTKTASKPSGSMLGCYQVKFAGFAGGPGSSEAFEIRNANDGQYELFGIDPNNSSVVPQSTGFKWERATPTILKIASAELQKYKGQPQHEGLDFNFTDGLTVIWEKGTENQRPMSIFRGKGEWNVDKYLFSFFIGTGIGNKIPCPKP